VNRRRTHKIWCVGIVFLVQLTVQLIALTPTVISLTPATLLRKVLQNNSVLAEQELKIRFAKLQFRSIKHKAFLPTFTFNVQFGVTPKSDYTFIEGLGPFARFELNALQPLYTFGKVSYAKELAGYGIDLARIRAKVTKEKLSVQILRIFWNLRAADKAHEIAIKLRKDYRKLLKEVQAESKKKESDITAVDLLNVKTSYFSIEQQYLLAEEGVRKVSAMLHTFLHTSNTIIYQPNPIALPAFDYQRITIVKTLRYSRFHRLELLAVKQVELAGQARLHLAKSMLYPDFFIAGGARYRWAAKRADDDDYNKKGLGAFLGLRWKLNFWQTGDGVKKAQLKLKSDRYKFAQLKTKIELEIKNAYIKLVREWKTLQAVRKSLKTSKTWYRLAGDNWEMGIGKVGEFIKAYTKYFVLEGAAIKQELSYVMALTRFAYVIGDVNLTLRWLKNEKVAL